MSAKSATEASIRDIRIHLQAIEQRLVEAEKLDNPSWDLVTDLEVINGSLRRLREDGCSIL